MSFRAKGKGKGKKKKKGEEDEGPIPRRLLPKLRICAVEELLSAVEDSVSLAGKQCYVVDNETFDGTHLFQFRDTIHFDLNNQVRRAAICSPISPPPHAPPYAAAADWFPCASWSPSLPPFCAQVHLEDESMRVKVLFAVKDGKPLLIDRKKSKHDIIKLFDSVRPGLLEQLLDGSILLPENHLPLITVDDEKSFKVTRDNFTVTPGFQVIITSQSNEPEQFFIDRCTMLQVTPSEKPKTHALVTDSKNPAGLEIKKRRGKGKGKR